nr:DH31 [Urechis unicinctus]
MQSHASTIVFTLTCLVLISSVTRTQALGEGSRRIQSNEVSDHDLMIDVLLELLGTLRGTNPTIKEKRQMGVDAGYGSRYDVVNRLSSKLMAMQQAADWNGPGRK